MLSLCFATPTNVHLDFIIIMASKDDLEAEEILQIAVRKQRAKEDFESEWSCVSKKKKKAKKLSLNVDPSFSSLKHSTLQELVLWCFDLTKTNPRSGGIVLENRTSFEKFLAVIVEVLP